MSFETGVKLVNSIVQSDFFVYLCLSAGAFFSYKTKFVQLRYLKEMGKLMLKRKKSSQGISSFQALCTTLAGRIGTGNIAGVATAISLGGPGSIFWMWVISLLGASTSFIECVLGQLYKEEVDGEYRGGPAYYIEKGTGKKGFGILFAFLIVIAMGFLLPGVQANSIASSMRIAFDIDSQIIGLILVSLISLIIFGGIKRIAVVSEFVVPFMGAIYLMMAIGMVVVNYTKIPEVFSLIIGSAFGKDQIFGGMLGVGISWGVKRGIYSNEAGRGTAPHAASTAESDHPAEQGFVQALSVFIDTLVICSATAFMIIVSGMYNVQNPEGGFLINNLPGVDMGPAYTQYAINTFLPGFGKSFIAIALFFFAFTSAMASYYIAETNITYLAKRTIKNEDFRKKVTKISVNIIRVVILTTIYLGTIRKSGIAWTLGDIGVAITAWINILAMGFIYKPALKVLWDYEKQLKEKGHGNITFNPKELDIEHAEFWENKVKDSKEIDSEVSEESFVGKPVTQ
ncbi:alanine/glycine:cation symporter family protein [Cetobacterium sp.]|uniref:alanine/glycine:cation symporter family protein n=2 Tax=Cetobacterium sp. TaxID=2071632 RepID=UPI002FC7C0CD